MTSYVSGAGGFIGGHLVQRLLDEDEDVIAVDIKPLNEWYQIHGAHNIHSCDLASPQNVNLDGVDRVYHLAADMGGMGFISSHRIDCMESVLITINLLQDAVYEGVQRFFYASSACVYPEHHQLDPKNPGLKESDAWPADPEPGYGLEKLYGEQLCKYYAIEAGLETRIARFHNIFGPHGTFKGGREKAPAAICRKIAEAKLYGLWDIEIWGDGEQSRSFLYVDECVEGIIRLMNSDYNEPLNIGSDELVTINELVTMVEGFAGLELDRVYDTSKPQGVRGRNSDNTLIREVLGWAPSQPLEVGMRKTFEWIESVI